ncbi:hypothetical protein ABZX85_20290 [Streptomyces sp. NPDC004539]
MLILDLVAELFFRDPVPAVRCRSMVDAVGWATASSSARAPGVRFCL